MSTRSLENWRTPASQEGPREVLEQLYPTGQQCREPDGQAEAQLVKLACSQAPAERTGCTLNLLANKLAEVEVAASILLGTLGCTLKKCQAVAEAAIVHCARVRCRFAYQLEQVLEAYCWPLRGTPSDHLYG